MVMSIHICPLTPTPTQTQVLNGGDVNHGYDAAEGWRTLSTFNGHEVRSLPGLYAAWRQATTGSAPFLEFSFSSGVERKIILDAAAASESEKLLLSLHGIPSRASARVVELARTRARATPAERSSEPAKAALAGSLATRERAIARAIAKDTTRDVEDGSAASAGAPGSGWATNKRGRTRRRVAHELDSDRGPPWRRLRGGGAGGAEH